MIYRITNYQNNEQISHGHKDEEPVQPIQMGIYLSNAYKIYLHQPAFDDQPKVQERQKLQDELFYMPLSNISIGTTSPDVTTVSMHRHMVHYHRTNQGSNFRRVIQTVKPHKLSALRILSEINKPLPSPIYNDQQVKFRKHLKQVTTSNHK